MIRKIKLFVKSRVLPIVLLLILCLPCFVSCDTRKQDDIEKLEKNLRIANNCNCLHKIQFNIPNGKNDHYLFLPSTYDDPNFADINVEKHCFKGVEYALEKPIRRSLDHICKDTIYSFIGTNESGEIIRYRYIDENKAPLYYGISEGSLYGKEKESFDFSDCIEVAKGFIDHIVNDCSDDNIDISKYIVENTEHEKNTVKFTRYFRNIPIHTVTVKLNNKCQAVSFAMNLPILDEDIYETIPDITIEQYNEMARGIVEEMYAMVHDEFLLSNFKIKGTPGFSGFDFQYSHGSDSYVIAFEPEFTVSLPDGTNEEDPMFMVSYILQPKPESEGS